MKVNDKVKHVTFENPLGVVKELMSTELDSFVLVEWERPVDGSRLHWERQDWLEIVKIKKTVKKAAKKSAKKSVKKAAKKTAKKAKR